MCREVTQIYVLDRGDAGFQKRVHLVSVDSHFNIKPTFSGGNWDWGYGQIHKVDFQCPSTWTKFIPTLKGCKATMLTLDNGRIVII